MTFEIEIKTKFFFLKKIIFKTLRFFLFESTYFYFPSFVSNKMISLFLSKQLSKHQIYTKVCQFSSKSVKRIIKRHHSKQLNQSQSDAILINKELEIIRNQNQDLLNKIDQQLNQSQSDAVVLYKELQIILNQNEDLVKNINRIQVFTSISTGYCIGSIIELLIRCSSS